MVACTSYRGQTPPDLPSHVHQATLLQSHTLRWPGLNSMAWCLTLRSKAHWRHLHVSDCEGLAGDLLPCSAAARLISQETLPTANVPQVSRHL